MSIIDSFMAAETPPASQEALKARAEARASAAKGIGAEWCVIIARQIDAAFKEENYASDSTSPVGTLKTWSTLFTGPLTVEEAAPYPALAGRLGNLHARATS